MGEIELGFLALPEGGCFCDKDEEIEIMAKATKKKPTKTRVTPKTESRSFAESMANTIDNWIKREVQNELARLFQLAGGTSVNIAGIQSAHQPGNASGNFKPVSSSIATAPPKSKPTSDASFKELIMQVLENNPGKSLTKATIMEFVRNKRGTEMAANYYHKIMKDLEAAGTIDRDRGNVTLRSSNFQPLGRN